MAYCIGSESQSINPGFNPAGIVSFGKTFKLPIALINSKLILSRKWWFLPDMTEKWLTRK